MVLVKILFLSLLLFFQSNCTQHKDTTKEAAILAFALDCRGGSTAQCYSTCNPICGISSTDNLTPTSNACIDTCQAGCATSCNVLSLYFTLQRQ